MKFDRAMKHHDINNADKLTCISSRSVKPHTCLCFSEFTCTCDRLARLFYDNEKAPTRNRQFLRDLLCQNEKKISVDVKKKKCSAHRTLHSSTSNSQLAIASLAMIIVKFKPHNANTRIYEGYVKGRHMYARLMATSYLLYFLFFFIS